MKNSYSMPYLPIYNENYNFDLFSIFTKLPNRNQNNYEPSNSNHPKNIMHRQNSAAILTTSNNQFNNQITNLVSSNTPINIENTNEVIYNAPIYLNGNDKFISSLNNNYKNQNGPSLKRFHSYENMNILNLPNNNLYQGQKNSIYYVDVKPIKRIIYNDSNNNKGFKVKRNNLKKIPFPKKSLQKYGQFLNKKTYDYNYNYNYNNNNNNNNYYNINNNNNINYDGQIISNENISNNIINNNIISNESTTNCTNYYSYNNIFDFTNYIQKYEEEPGVDFKLDEFNILNEIAHGSEGGIYIVKWKKNNKNYALKKCLLMYDEYPKKRKKEFLYLKEFMETNGCDGIIKTYGTLCQGNEFGAFDYYELMELADRDWEQEILSRQRNNLYYQEYELMEIFKSLIKTFCSLQSIHYTHRDIKPQNIMLVKGKFKISDFGNAKLLKNKGMIIQRIRGSELFMSPIIYNGWRSGMQTIKHNTFKSDVFSLGMCFFFASCYDYNALKTIRQVNDMNFIRQTLNQYLGKRYSQKLINLLFNMLQVEEDKRPDFTELEILLL